MLSDTRCLFEWHKTKTKHSAPVPAPDFPKFPVDENFNGTNMSSQLYYEKARQVSIKRKTNKILKCCFPCYSWSSWLWGEKKNDKQESLVLLQWGHCRCWATWRLILFTNLALCVGAALGLNAIKVPEKKKKKNGTLGRTARESVGFLPLWLCSLASFT